MTIKISSRKAKGRNFQNLIAKKISEITGIPVQKDGEIESRPMSQSGVDIILRGKALELFPFSVECCCAETWNVNKKIEQAKSNTKSGTDWLCFFKSNKKDPIAVLSTEVFFQIYNTYLRMQEMINEELK
uniref:Holliday junction resolvase n=1 Tax=viral metagenome TaxID=1070528 RepID=A0A6M3XQI4_9ZZZZ